MRTLVSRLIVAGLAAIGSIVFLAAQVPAFLLTVHVHDDALRSPTGLESNDFEVRIDGRPRPIRSVRPAGPFSLLLLLDTSASMNDVVPPSKLVEAAAAVVAQLRPADRLRVAAFDTRVEMGPDFGSTLAPVSDFLKRLSYNGATCLYDALDASLTTLERQPGRGIIIVLSDGSDTASRLTGDDVLNHALRSHVQVWTMLQSGKLPRVMRRGPDGPFMRIVEDTGGMSVHPKDTADLGRSLSDVVRHLREQYLIEVDAAPFDRDLHKVAVRIKRRGLTLRAPRSAAIALRPGVPPAMPPSFWDPATGAPISGPGVVGPKAVYSPPPRYPQSALKDRMTGEVFMEVIVDETGRVQSARVTRSLRADLDDAAVATLKTWRFEPARKDGQPVPAQIVVTMSFNVK